MCNHDCFNCIYEDCVVDEITQEERIDIDNRNNSIKPRYQWYWKNPELHRKKSLEYYYRNSEKKKAQNREYYQSHKKEHQALNRRWKEEHKELVKARQHQYYLNWKRKKELANEV